MIAVRSKTLTAIAALVVIGRAAGIHLNASDDAVDPVLAEIVRRPLPLRDGIGIVHDPVTTTSARAQSYFDQGLAYLHSFVWIEAARSFNQALEIDPNLAMAHVGLSYALAELGATEEARSASRHASALAERVTDRERRRITVRVKQLAASAKPDDPTLRSDYQAELDRAVVDYPRDVELLLLRGQAEEPTHSAHGMSSGTGSLRFYERALAERSDDFATHHLLVHAYENGDRMDRALEHATMYAQMAPAIPHAHHMYGHVLRRVARMDDAIVEFRRADDLELAYFRAENIPAEYDWHYHHNLDLLGASYEYVGQMRSAEQALRRSFELPSKDLSQELSKRLLPAFLLARGRPEEALTASRMLSGEARPIGRALGHLLASRSMIALGRTDGAVEEGDVALGQMRSIGAVGGVLVPELQLTQGALLMRSGQAEKGRGVLHEAVTKVRAERGPDAWIQTLFTLEALFRVARDAGDWTLAREFGDELRQYDPDYAGGHYANAQIAEHEADRGTARAELEHAIERWGTADADFTDLRDARRRLATLNLPAGR